MGRARNALIAAAGDIGCVLVFVVIGRASHVKGESLAGTASTGWPFLCGLAAGWAAAWAVARARPAPAGGSSAGRPWPLAVSPAGIVIWLSTVALGMVLRVIAGQGTAAAFIVVALVFLGLFLPGWRLVAALAGRRLRARAGSPAGEPAGGREAEASTGP